MHSSLAEPISSYKAENTEAFKLQSGISPAMSWIYDELDMFNPSHSRVKLQNAIIIDLKKKGGGRCIQFGSNPCKLHA